MIEQNSTLEINLDRESKSLRLQYQPRTERTIYDLCDLNGRVIRSGKIEHEETVLDITGLNGRGYVMLIVDGDQVISKRISLAA